MARTSSNHFSVELETLYAATFDKLVLYVTRLYVKELLSSGFYMSRENALDGFKRTIDSLRKKVSTSQAMRRTLKSMKSIFSSAEKKILSVLVSQAKKSGVSLPKVAFRGSSHLELAIKDNVKLISTVTSEHAFRVEEAIRTGLSQGARREEIIDEVVSITRKSRSYARFVAADQLAKAYAAINEEKQAVAGVPGYIWSAKNDSKTRDTHRILSGKYFEWTVEKPNDPRPRDKSGRILHPGEDYRCRCFAIPSWGA